MKQRKSTNAGEAGAGPVRERRRGPVSGMESALAAATAFEHPARRQLRGAIELIARRRREGVSFRQLWRAATRVGLDVCEATFRGWVKQELKEKGYGYDGRKRGGSD